MNSARMTAPLESSASFDSRWLRAESRRCPGANSRSGRMPASAIGSLTCDHRRRNGSTVTSTPRSDFGCEAKNRNARSGAAPGSREQSSRV